MAAPDGSLLQGELDFNEFSILCRWGCAPCALNYSTPVVISMYSISKVSTHVPVGSQPYLLKGSSELKSESVYNPRHNQK
ncbi:hypothetical protein UPYG_G00265010 [Umbra pygmaea]|uniref:Uncharacterized protein n=1 Tax=Umbra pygmaea TaxID=75934 RepID=A0ABD0WET3_UMBPY